MELSEAKKKAINIIYTLNEQIEEGDYHNCEYLESIQEEIDTIQVLLKALDNSISKEYHEMAIKEQNDIIEDLKSKLDNSISKDEIRKKIKELNYPGKGTYIRGEKILILQELLGE